MKRHSFFHKMQKSSSKHLWFFLIASYTIVMFLPLAINFIVYLNAYRTIRTQAMDAQEAALTYLSSNMDNTFQQIANFVTVISYDVNLNGLLNASGIESYEQSYNTASRLYDLNETLQLNLPSGSLISEYYIFSPRNNLLFHNSGINELDRYIQRSDNLSRSLYETCLTLDMSQIQIFSLNVSENTSYTVVTYPLPYTYIAKGYIAILLNNESLNTQMESFYSQEGSRIYLVNRNVQVTNDSNTLSSPEIFAGYDFSEGSIEGRPGIDNERLLIYSAPSSILPLSYICTIPESVATSSLIYMRQTLIISMLFCLLGEVLLIAASTHYNYQPWKKLIHAVHTISPASNEKTGKKGSEYQIVFNALTSMYNQKSSVEETLKDRNIALTTYRLSGLLKGRTNIEDLEPEVLEEFQTHLQINHYAVLLLFIDSVSTAETDDIAAGPKASAFLAPEILEKALAPFGILTITTVDNYIAGVLGIGNSTIPNSTEQISSAVKQVLTTLPHQDGILYFLSMSAIHDSISQMSAAYEEAVSASSICVMRRENYFLTYEEVKSDLEQPGQLYSSSEEQALANDIRLGRRDETARRIKTLMTEIENTYPSFETAKLAVVNILYIVTKTFSTLPDETRELIHSRYTTLLEDFMSAASLRRLEKSLLDLADLAAEYGQSSNEPISVADFWTKKVDLQIEQNLCAENLNVSFIADNLGISAKYLSSLYQKSTGRNIVDTIHKKRIEKFKELISNDDMNINDAAAAVGYTNIATLNRWVKKYEGVTPGQLKILSRK